MSYRQTEDRRGWHRVGHACEWWRSGLLGPGNDRGEMAASASGKVSRGGSGRAGDEGGRVPDDLPPSLHGVFLDLQRRGRLDSGSFLYGTHIGFVSSGAGFTEYSWYRGQLRKVGFDPTGLPAVLSTGPVRVTGPVLRNLVRNLSNVSRKMIDVYIGRPSRWGNPFNLTASTDRREVIRKYAQYLLGRPDLLRDVGQLRGKVLGCWCAPQRCHGDVLARLALVDTVSERVSLLNKWLGRV